MGLINDFELNENMSKEQVLEQLFIKRKKIINRQNSADLQKRSKAEFQLEILSHLENSINEMSDNFTSIGMLLELYAFSLDNELFTNELKTKISQAIAGDGNSAGMISNFLKDNNQHELSFKWLLWAAECGAIGAYQALGCTLIDLDTEEAIKWYEKADRANFISVINLYNWGLIYYKRHEYNLALEKFQRASDGGEGNSARLLGEMYEHGLGVEINLNKALEYYLVANQRGINGLLKKIDEIKSKVGYSSNNSIISSNSTHSKDQPILVHKSDRQPMINVDAINLNNFKNIITIDDIKEKFENTVEDVSEKVNIKKIKEKVEKTVDDVSEKVNLEKLKEKVGKTVGGVAEKVNLDKIKNFTWKKK